MDYPSSHGPGEEHDGQPDELDMDIMHDFGEGVGVDMRDFAVHNGNDDEHVLNGGLSHSIAKHTIDPSLSTHHPSRSSNGHGEPPSSASAAEIDDIFKAETGLDGEDEDDEEDGQTTPQAKRSRPNNDVPGGFTFVDKDGESGRRKIRIEYITDKSRRHITFSKRKAGIMKKAYELSILTGTQVLLLVVSETGLVYTFTTTKLQPLVQKAEGKNLIQACLHAPDGYDPDGMPSGGPVTATKAKNGGLAIRPHKLTPSATAALAASAHAASLNQAGSQQHVQDEHAMAQQDASASVGQGTPVLARPKKRLPSGKGKKAAAAAALANGVEILSPVPQIPDMHRQPSPHTANLISPSLASPMSAGGYHIPPEYHHQASPTNPTFGYAGGPPPDFQQGYYAPPTPQTHAHGAYLNVPAPQAHMYGQPDQRDRRMMIDSQGRSIGMGM